MPTNEGYLKACAFDPVKLKKKASFAVG